MLATLGTISTPESVWDDVGDNLRTLRTHGLTVPFPDAVLATLAIANSLELWTHDAHFPLIQKWLPALKLFQEPP
jgi:predicted nucleic acid-binding protein